MKLITEIDSISDLSFANMAFLEFEKNFPNLKAGESKIILANGRKFSVTRNKNSVTVKNAK